jgi:hypothetical protein
MSALGQKRTRAAQEAMSALPPKATAEADMPQIVMSALPPIATEIADMAPSPSNWVRFANTTLICHEPAVAASTLFVTAWNSRAVAQRHELETMA